MHNKLGATSKYKTLWNHINTISLSLMHTNIFYYCHIGWLVVRASFQGLVSESSNTVLLFLAFPDNQKEASPEQPDENWNSWVDSSYPLSHVFIFMVVGYSVPDKLRFLIFLSNSAVLSHRCSNSRLTSRFAEPNTWIPMKTSVEQEHCWIDSFLLLNWELVNWT